MPGPEEITQRLETAGIDYCIVGGLASIAYGRPRLTLDADLVVALDSARLEQLVSAFPEEDFYLPPVEILQAELQRDSRGHFNIIHQHSALRADCYLPGKSELSKWEMQSRRRLPLRSGEAWFAPPEAVIVNKVFYPSLHQRAVDGSSSDHNRPDVIDMFFCEPPPWKKGSVVCTKSGSSPRAISSSL